MIRLLLLFVFVAPNFLKAQQKKEWYVGAAFLMPTLWMPKKEYSNTNYKAIGPGSGVSLMTGFSKKHWTFQVAVEYKTLTTYKSENRPYRDSFVNGKTSFLSLPLQIDYGFNSGKNTQFYVSVGGSFLNATVKSHFELYDRKTDSIITGSLFFPISSTINLGIGVTRKLSSNISIFARFHFEAVNNFQSDIYNSYSHSTPPIQIEFNIDNLYSGLAMGIRYRIGKKVK